ncbi:hypothetical protein XA68_17075 [Ophiocordyceps unilateralis]|uniref:Uncharacterized protein n=1 Tax=Ophiocordyceps unilateralis TaxID=268505 RepID=A0A2A9P536_OPHUN|nr:hypothetical protein XA68_17075 [Ophiocordyceps unilateralis]
MASPSTHALPEHWTELIAARRQRRLCASDVKAIRNRCLKDCGKRQLADCASCYGKALDRMRRRYTESREREWFTQRRAFLHELEGLFQEAKEGKRSLDVMEARIESEKEAWYRWVLRRYPEFIAVSDGSRGSSQDELRSMLDDPDRSRLELVSLMLGGIGTPPGGLPAVDAFADKVVAAGQDEAALKALYLNHFFVGDESGSGSKYQDVFRAHDAPTRLEAVIDAIVSDMKESRASQPVRDAHQRRLDELRRAKMAFEQNKMQVRSRALNRKAAAAVAATAAAAASSVREELYNLPPCLVCARPVDSRRVLSCSLCQAMVQLGSGRGTLTVYCSDACFSTGHGQHIDTSHACEAGDRCLQLSTTTSTATTDNDSKPSSCKVCLEQHQRITLYCSDRCARSNAPVHIRRYHPTTTTTTTRLEDDALAPTDVVVQRILVAGNPGLVMARAEAPP